MGGKGGSPTIPNSPSDKQQAIILKNLEAQVGKPIRDVVVPQALQTLSGPGVFQTSLPAPDRQAIEDQFKQAQNALMNSGTRGGQLQSQLATLNRDRAATVASATNEATQRGIERALGLVPSAIPNAATQMNARSQSASTEQSRLIQNAQLQAQQQQAKGQGIGGLVGGIGGLFK